MEIKIVEIYPNRSIVNAGEWNGKIFIQEKRKKSVFLTSHFTFSWHSQESSWNNRSNRKGGKVCFLRLSSDGLKANERTKIRRSELCHVRDQYFAIDIVLLWIFLSCSNSRNDLINMLIFYHRHSFKVAYKTPIGKSSAQGNLSLIRTSST